MGDSSAFLPILPEDVLFCMAKYMQISDLHSARLAFRAWRKPAAKFLFKRVYISCHERDIEYFEKITNNPELVVYVEELVVDESTFNEALLNFEVFLHLTDVHPPDCLHNNSQVPEYDGDAKKNRQWHERTAEECGHDTARARERQIETAERVFKWLRAEIEKHWANRTTHRDFKVVRNAIVHHGLRIKRFNLTSLPFDPVHDNRPDQPYEPPRRSPAVRQWEQEIPDSEGLVRRAEILPKVNWLPPDTGLSWVLSWLENGNETRLQELSDPGHVFSEWQSQNGAGYGPRSPPCYHPAAVTSPFRGLILGLRTFEETSTKLSEFSVIPSGRGHPRCCECCNAVGLGMSAAIFMPKGLVIERLLRLAGQVRALRLVLEMPLDLEGRLGPRTVLDQHPEWTDGRGNVVRYPELTEMLQTGRKLEEVYLNLANDQLKLVDINFLRGLKPTWLRQMHLHDVCLTDATLFTFVYENRHSLGELVVFYCLLLKDGESWWWPMLDELRRMGCLRGMDMYINSVHEGEQTLKMDGDPGRREGVARWKRWIADGERFPLSASDSHHNAVLPGRGPADYRDRLRAAFARLP